MNDYISTEGRRRKRRWIPLPDNDPDVVPAPVWIVLDDYMIAIRCWYSALGSAMSFRVYDVVGVDSKDPHSDQFDYQLIDSMIAYPLSHYDSVTWEFDGFLRFDGCINWQTNPVCMAHGCDTHYPDRLRDIFAVVYAVGSRTLSCLGDTIPTMPPHVIEIPEPVVATR